MFFIPGAKQEQQSPQKGLANGTAPNTPASGKKKKNKGGQENGTSAPGTPNNASGKQGASPTPKKSLEGGVIVEDMKVGAGVPAKSGKMVSWETSLEPLSPVKIVYFSKICLVKIWIHIYFEMLKSDWTDTCKLLFRAVLKQGTGRRSFESTGFGH